MSNEIIPFKRGDEQSGCLGIEITLTSFDGATDETDDQVIWVSVPAIGYDTQRVQQMLKDAGVDDLIGSVTVIDMDFEMLRGDINFALPESFDGLLADIKAKATEVWTKEDSEHAMSQGWDVFEAGSVDGKVVQIIERDDESATPPTKSIIAG